MNFFILIILAIVQGLTEFLPISSSGHLVLLNNFFGIDNDIKLLSILLHIATLFSVIIYYRKDIIVLIKNPLCQTNKKIILTTIFTCLTVLLIKPIIDATFSGVFIFAFFIITAMLLFISDYLTHKYIVLSRTSNFKAENIHTSTIDIRNIPINYRQAIIIGLTQGIACIPGISRCGSTIAVGQMIGAKDTARYSFLISIPIIIASFLMEIIEGGISNDISVIPLITSMIVCFVIGLLCIKFMNKIVSKNRLSIFGYYLLALSTILVILSFIK